MNAHTDTAWGFLLFCKCLEIVHCMCVNKKEVQKLWFMENLSSWTRQSGSVIQSKGASCCLLLTLYVRICEIEPQSYPQKWL